MSNRRFLAGAVACLALGIGDLVALNLWLVPAAWPPVPDDVSSTTQESLALSRLIAPGVMTPDEALMQSESAEAPVEVVDPEVLIVSAQAADTRDEPRGNTHPGNEPAAEEPVLPNEGTATDEIIAPEQVIKEQTVVASVSNRDLGDDVSAGSPDSSAADGSGQNPKPNVADLSAGIDDNHPELTPQPPLLHTRVQFATAKDSLNQEAIRTLEEVLVALKRHPHARVRVDGHTDRRGSDEYNYRLSEQRAAAVVSFLIQRGIAEDRISSRGLGPSQPIDPGNNAAAWAKNRRAEIRLWKGRS
jgi:outer membrane protein OmpA-like peptidoglycan-associated protein